MRGVEILRTQALDELSQRAAVAVLVLDEHAVGLCPRRVVLHDMRVLDEDCMGANLFPRSYFQGAAGNGLLGALDGVGTPVQAVDTLEHVAELAVAQFADLVELFVVAGD